MTSSKFRKPRISLCANEDLETGELKKEEVELLVLSTGLLPSERNERLAKVLKIPLDKLGYFKEKDPFLAQLETDVPGIYLCGGATGPIDISESVVQATGREHESDSPEERIGACWRT